MQQICHTSSNLKPIASARTPLCERPGTPTLPASHWSTSRGRLCVSRSHRDCRIVTSATSAPASAAPIERRSFLPLIGETPQILADGNAFLKKRTEELGPVFRSHFALSECVIVTDSKLINQVLQAEHKTVIFDLLPSSSSLGRNSCCLVASLPYIYTRKRYLLKQKFSVFCVFFCIWVGGDLSIHFGQAPSAFWFAA